MRPLRSDLKQSLLAIVAVVAACTDGTGAAESDQALADTLKAKIAAAYDLSRPGAIDRMTALYPDSGRVISASGGQIVVGIDSLRAGIGAFWENVGRNMRNPKWQWGDVYLDRLGPDAAVLTATWSIPHLTPMGAPHVIRGAWTAVFRRLEGRWLIVVEHLSAPASAN